jgi:trehalose 6-phosphate synthase
MPLAERQARHQRLLQQIRTQDVHWWRETFLAALDTVEVVEDER